MCKLLVYTMDMDKHLLKQDIAYRRHKERMEDVKAGIALGICVLGILFFLGRTITTYYQIF